MPAITKCSICSNPKKREQIARWHAAGVSFVEMHRRTETQEWRDKGFKRGINTATISRHINRDLAGDLPGSVDARTRKEVTVAAAKIVAGGDSIPTKHGLRHKDDVATLVQRIAMEKLKAGEMRVTTKDGLQAQALLDRRDEKTKDRNAGMALFKLIAAAMAPASVLPKNVTVIEGIAETVE